ncbi:MBL fold metallo-hydrolase [Halovivax cerinus]|uniref:MBL fold metallo-hydrolase n=1 Tax=Halovivax cerinus TaxID=1487865 RepID=A0ABD5NTV7_9EURY|nr:MBL fold metallo-hydrolase [Halovivax cerinus]
MDVSFQHTNVGRGNESTLLRFTTRDGRRACVLVDAGDDVDVTDVLDDDEYLTAILLTHAHIDHYRSLARNVVHGAPVYATPATAALVERALPEATKDNDVGPVDRAIEALTPITDWVDVLPEVAVRPVPAGHAPGAAGFVCRFADDRTQLGPDDNHVVITGDFTRRDCAGFGGFPGAFPFAVDTLILNAPTNDGYEAALQDAVRTVLERAYGGSHVVAAAGSLAGLHLARLLEAIVDRIDRPVPITAVGQTAKLCDAIDWAPSTVDRRAVFERPSDVLTPGGITICGPADPVRGSAARLFDAIADDPAALFVQLTPDDAGVTDGQRCTTRSFDCSNHPSRQTVDGLIARLAPRQVVVSHAGLRTLKSYQRDLEDCFVWGSADRGRHRLYEDGSWAEPAWLGDGAVRTIHRKHRRRLEENPPCEDTSLPAVAPGPVDPTSEGIDVDALRDRFGVEITNPYAERRQPSTSADADPLEGGVPDADAPPAAGGGTATRSDDDSDTMVVTYDDADGSVADTRLRVAGAAERDAPVDGDAVIESSSTDGPSFSGGSSDPSDVDLTDWTGERPERFEAAVLDRLDAIERSLPDPEPAPGVVESVPAVVLGGGDDRLLKPLGDVSLDPGERVSIEIRRVSPREVGCETSRQQDGETENEVANVDRGVEGSETPDA